MLVKPWETAQTGVSLSGLRKVANLVSKCRALHHDEAKYVITFSLRSREYFDLVFINLRNDSHGNMIDYTHGPEKNRRPW